MFRLFLLKRSNQYPGKIEFEIFFLDSITIQIRPPMRANPNAGQYHLGKAGYWYIKTRHGKDDFNAIRGFNMCIYLGKVELLQELEGK